MHSLHQMFQAASHAPEIKDALHIAKLHFRENGFDVTVKAPTRHFLGLIFKAKF